MFDSPWFIPILFLGAWAVAWIQKERVLLWFSEPLARGLKGPHSVSYSQPVSVLIAYVELVTCVAALVIVPFVVRALAVVFRRRAKVEGSPGAFFGASVGIVGVAIAYWYWVQAPLFRSALDALMTQVPARPVPLSEWVNFVVLDLWGPLLGMHSALVGVSWIRTRLERPTNGFTKVALAVGYFFLAALLVVLVVALFTRAYLFSLLILAAPAVALLAGGTIVALIRPTAKSSARSGVEP